METIPARVEEAGRELSGKGQLGGEGGKEENNRVNNYFLKGSPPSHPKKERSEVPGFWIRFSRSTAHVSRVGAAGWFPKGGQEAGI